MKVSLRTALVAMLLTATVPVAVLMSYLLLDKMQHEQERMRHALDREALVLSQAVEHELVATIEALRILGLSESLRVGDVREFERSVSGRGPLRAGWQGSFLTDTRGVVIFDTTRAGQRGALAPVAGFRQMLWDRTPMVSGLMQHKPSGQASTVIAVPVIIDGELRFGLGVWVPWAAWQVLLKRATPEEGFATLYDQGRNIIARSIDPEHHVGRPLPDAPLPGEANYESAAAVNLAGWGVRRGIAAAPVAAAQIRSIAFAWLTAAGCLLLGVTMALLLARRITRPLSAMARHGSAAAPGVIHVREIEVLRDALQAARERDQEAHDVLRRKADEFETLFNSSPIGLSFAQDTDCRNVLRNAAMGHLFGAIGGDAEPVVYRGGEPLPPDQMPLCVSARSGQAVAMMELEFRFEGRPSVHAIANAVPLRDGLGRPRGAISAMVDITMRKEMEARLRETHEQLTTADRAKDEFLAMLGHELRNPLSAIASAVEVLSRRRESNDQMAATACEIINRQTLHLSHMMGDLLDVTRLISGKVVLARQPLDWSRLVRQSVETLSLTGAASQHPIELDLHEAWIDADSTRMEQVVVNLVGNAIKYTPLGRPVRVVLRAEEGEAVLQVIDSGDGIPADLLPRVFDLFVQGKRSLDRHVGGLGIGLTLVKRMVDLHGGTVTATSSSAGSCFEVRLPRVAAVNLQPESQEQQRPGLRVLVVEDNPDALKSMSDVLALDGHGVTGEGNGRSGLATLLSQWPDVAIVDIGLPEIDGFEVARRARARGYAGRMIAVSGYGQEQDRHRALKAGFDAHVVKPVDLAQLRELMREGVPAYA